MKIAIDGPAGAGKSTVGKALARALACAYLDTGLMYRAVAFLALRRNVSPSDAHGLTVLAREIGFELDPVTRTLLVDGEPDPAALHSGPVDAVVSQVSAHPEVRAELVRRQRLLAESGCIVMVGRDIGTVVLPDAPVKLWVTASPEERARRRLLERAGTPGAVTEEEMLRQIRTRDALDTNRPSSPLRRPDGAVAIETDRLSPDEALSLALQAVEEAADEPVKRRT
ncbi:MAG: (d)CMP kinase [Chloroflexi bacterium]|nr:(d)CMP kinase [Chloroflexota bacterium]